MAKPAQDMEVVWRGHLMCIEGSSTLSECRVSKPMAMLYFLLKVSFLNHFTMLLLCYLMMFLLLLFNIRMSYCCRSLLEKKTTNSLKLEQ